MNRLSSCDIDKLDMLEACCHRAISVLFALQLLDFSLVCSTAAGCRLQVGDASSIQSPLSFGGFGALTRHLARLTSAITGAVQVQGVVGKP